jgi:hypothetical protein
MTRDPSFNPPRYDPPPRPVVLVELDTHSEVFSGNGRLKEKPKNWEELIQHQLISQHVTFPIRCRRDFHPSTATPTQYQLPPLRM